MTAVRVVAVTGNPASPSRTRALAQHIVEEIGRHLTIEPHFIEIYEEIWKDLKDEVLVSYERQKLGAA